MRQPRINARIPPDGQTATSKSREPTRGGGFGAIATCTFGPTSSANNNHIIKSTLFLLNKKKNRAHIGRNTNYHSIFSYPLSNEQGPATQNSSMFSVPGRPFSSYPGLHAAGPHQPCFFFSSFLIISNTMMLVDSPLRFYSWLFLVVACSPCDHNSITGISKERQATASKMLAKSPAAFGADVTCVNQCSIPL